MQSFLKKKSEKRLSESKAIYYLNQLRLAYFELRKQNVMHRDIKLENLFLHNDTLKLGDFGFAKIDKNFAHSKLGSKFNMAPEIILHLNEDVTYNYKIDLWSIGCVFYEMLFGIRFISGPKRNMSLKDVINTLNAKKYQKIHFPLTVSPLT